MNQTHSHPTPRGTHSQAESLARQAMENHPGARESLLHQLYPMLASVVHRYPQVFPSREDALQEGRVIILEALYSYNPKTGVPFLAYARQKLWYHFMNQARVRKELTVLDGASHSSGTSGEEGGDSWLSQIPDTQPLPDEQLINDELHQWLSNALEHLHCQHQQLFHEHYGKHKSLKQIAEETGLHPVTLSRRKAALLTELRQQLH